MGFLEGKNNRSDLCLMGVIERDSDTGVGRGDGHST